MNLANSQACVVLKSLDPQFVLLIGTLFPRRETEPEGQLRIIRACLKGILFLFLKQSVSK